MTNANDDKSLMKKNMLVTVAKMYYLERMTQQEIADALYISRSNVSRMLKMCVERHVVEFYINETSSLGYELGERIKEAYPLRDVIVVPSQATGELTKAKLGKSLVMYLRSRGLLKTGMTLGVAWGTTLYGISTAFRPFPDLSVDVYQLVGGRDAKSRDTDGVEITRRIAKNLNGNAFSPHIPYIVKDAKLKQMLLKEPEIRDYFEQAERVSLALVGLGSSDRILSSANRAGYISGDDIKMQLQAGAVCDICGIQLNGEGEYCAEEFDKKRIGISYESLKSIPCVIGAAVGVEKTPAISAALKSGLIHVLATDEAAAFSVLRQA